MRETTRGKQKTSTNLSTDRLFPSIMAETQALFLLQVLIFTPSINIPAPAEALNLSTAATVMRITCLKKKAADNRCNNNDFEFLAKVLECSNGKIDFIGLAVTVGMNNSAVRMRLMRLRRKFSAAEPAKPRKAACKTTDGGRYSTGMPTNSRFLAPSLSSPTTGKNKRCTQL
jgi:hypothetical protein